MGRMITRILGQINKRPVYLPKKYEEQIRQELISTNIKRERILAVTLTFFLTIIISCKFTIKNTAILHKYISINSIEIHFILVTLALLFLILTHNFNKNTKANYFKLKLLHEILVFSTMILFAVVAVDNYALNLRPFAYTIAMYSIASTLFLNRNEGLTVYIISYIIQIAGIIYLEGINWRVFETIASTLPLLIFALVLLRINYSSFVNSFVSNLLIQEKNQQLDNMYKTVEEVLSLRTEQLSHAMEIDKLRTTFFSNISHEFRTPLNIISSAEQMLQLISREENIQDKKQEILKYNDMIQQNCYRLIRLVENLIDITEIDTGQSNIKLGNHDIVELMKGIASAAAGYVKNHGIRLTFYSDMKHEIIACDAGKIERVILNLLSNAVKFTPPGGCIQVRLSEDSENIMISVRDSGIGIPQEKKNAIFDRFVQVDQSTTRLREGSGIGLAIVKAFVEQHRGKIELTSAVGQGSDFVLTLPKDLIACEEGNIHAFKEYKCCEKVKMEFSDIYDVM